jgi:hypothetical protein
MKIILISYIVLLIGTFAYTTWADFIVWNSDVGHYTRASETVPKEIDSIINTVGLITWWFGIAIIMGIYELSKKNNNINAVLDAPAKDAKSNRLHKKPDSKRL